ncbi:MAG: CPBP family intramembrane glutamic endopeptidase [Phycisphaerae bacterium]
MSQDDPIRNTQLTLKPLGQQCTYCGAQLDERFYFCPVCATPFRSIETVVTPFKPQELTDSQRIERNVPQVKVVFTAVAATVVLSAMASFLLFQGGRPDLQLIFETVALGGVTFVLAAIYRKSLWAQLGRIGFDRPAAWASLLALPVVLGINWLWHAMIQQAIGWEDFSYADPLREAGMTTTQLVLLFCLAPAIVEELSFRGLLQHWMQTTLSPARALLISSALFAGLHFSLLSFPYLLLVGLLLGWSKWKTGSLYPAMVIHFIHNYVVVVIWS